jgi:hypothetical protein
MVPAIILIVLTIISYACKDDGTNPQDKEFVLPESNLTYIDDIGPLFLAKCGSNSGCHNPTDKAGGLDITNYQAIRLHRVDTEESGTVNLVIPLNGEGSFLYQVLFNNFFKTPRMPKDGPYLNSNNTNGVKTWIDEGAIYSSD